MSAPDPTGQPLLVIIDPVARRADGESVRIARDVLCAGAVAKICLTDGPGDLSRALSRRGRRPVVIGDDRALLRVVGLLHRRRELAGSALSVVPVGAPHTVALAHALGVPRGPVAAARAVLDGAPRPLDLLVDDSDGVVLGEVCVPDGYVPGASPYAPGEAGDGLAAGTGPQHPDGGPEGRGGLGRPDGPGEPAVTRRQALTAGGHQSWWSPAARTARTALALLTGPAARHPLPSCTRLRVEADGVLLADLDRPVERVRVSVVDGLAEVVVHHPSSARPVRARARAVTVSGPDFRYRADDVGQGPVRSRTWTALPGAWRLTLPR
ncbi:hypothetical protein WEB32_16455 [Streptomyces netropsis]|uniref:hypothetical protein n=1 Tax=Streptomyces netropsis TaxID=55404 RepID=UPI0030CF5DE8